MNQEDASHLPFLKQVLGLNRCDVARVAFAIASADNSKKTTRIGFQQTVKARIFRYPAQ
jgi:hypothetical protein